MTKHSNLLSPTGALDAAAQRTTLHYDGPVPDSFLTQISDRSAIYDLPTRARPGGLTVTQGGATVDLRASGNSLDIEIKALTEISLHYARETVMHLLDHVLVDASADLSWIGDQPASDTPPNFYLATLLKVERIAAHMQRITLACDNVAALMIGGMHFSLLLPPSGRAPHLPYLNDKLRTIWPEGPDALHRAAYTFVTLDPVRGQFTFDIFEHNGGITTSWAEDAVLGDTVGVMGPGGGDFPESECLLLAGDETALPAIRRIAENAPQTCRGDIMIEVGSVCDIVPINTPPLMTLRWIIRPEESDLATQLLEIDHITPETFIWVAAEQSTVRRAKQHFVKLGATREKSYFSHYWVQR